MSTPYTPLLIANMRTSVDLGIDPWLSPEDAWQEVLDAYHYKGTITKRNGYSWFDSMPYAVTGSSGNEYQNISDITTTASALVTTHGPHGLTTGKIIRLTDVEGISAGTDGVPINGTRWTVTVLTTDTFTLNNALPFVGSYTTASGTLSTFPGNPIMAIAVWLDSANIPNLMVLDTERAAIYDNTQMTLKPIGFTRQFTGSDSNLFWWENYLGKIYFTNNVDNIFYWDGTQLATGLTPFTPNFTSGVSGDIVNNCLMIKALNNRLCLYNTNETLAAVVSNYPTRVRWCQGKIDPTTTGAWFDNVPGFGGDFDDLTGSLYIISQAQIQTNNLVISQNQQFSVIYEQRNAADIQNPFVFVKIATSRNVNSTFGTIILDREVQLMGNSGLILTDGNSVGRYDDKIPDFSIDVLSADNFNRAFGVRNDRFWQSWTLYTSSDNSASSDTAVNDKILVFNYQDKSWQFYRISLACAGIFPYPGIDPTWASYGSNLPDFTWEDFGEETWNSIPQAETPMLLGGGYDGNIWWMDQGGGDAADNVAYGGIVLPGFTAVGNPITMEITSRQWFPYAKEGSAAQFGYVDFLIDGDPASVIGVTFNVDNETENYLTSFFTCIPYENIDFSTIDNILQSNPCEIISFDHGLVTGQVVYIFSVQGMIELNGLSAIITVIDSATITLDGVDSTAFTPYLSGGIIAQSPITQNTFWTRVNVGQTGVFHQMTITAQGVNESFRLHALTNWFKRTGRIYKG